ncbi:MAG: bifunctional (p)ppGpp synthetase/guanosine-3',5'-bis(diphosphate) 3'-pyrophosphohydrolase [Clostridia bacterium]|nr:bifunctional (p)ppGpp synthetase/guanosine-3',5'-bis(diphosphate) 3'-pyrophosphohydrolase [Clostridia bacterium]
MEMEKELLDEIREIYGEKNLIDIVKAFEFAKVKHEGDKRDTGEDYIIHPYHVAKILVGFRADVPSVISGLLHDCLEDTDCTDQEIIDNFGKEIYNICLGASKIEPIKHARRRHLEENENLRKMFLAMSKDARVAFVKLADRLHNMRTLAIKSRENQLKIAKETLDIYVPLAERLGMNELKHMLEDLCFEYIFPEEYVEVTKYLEDNYKKGKAIIAEIRKSIEALAQEHNIDCRLQSRMKSSFGVFKKTTTKGRHNVLDVIANRIIVKEIKDCYTMLGAVHNLWKPVDGRIKDYIAQPKKNLYMSLHTTVMYPTEYGEIPFEIQIRTEEMHIYCEYGMAAHWMYKEHGSKATKNAGNSAIYNMKKNLSQSTQNVLQENEADEFMQIIKTGFYENKIFVLTPNLNVVELPEGSIPLDFAYAVHTSLGNRCSGAKVNDKMVPITTKLATGDVVEILTVASKGPSRDWIKLCKSRGAVAKIKNYFKKEKKEENIKIGKEMLEEQAKRKGYSLSKLFEDKETLAEIAFKHHLLTIEEIYAAVGYGGITVPQVLGKFISKQQKLQKQEKKAELAMQKVEHKTGDASVIIDGHDDLLKKVAKCCNPIPGDDIIGYVSRGRGVTIHRRNCATLNNLEPDRIVETNWNEKSLSEVYNANFKVITRNSSGVLSSISLKIADSKVDITFIKGEVSKTGDAIIHVGVRVKSRNDLMDLINKIKTIPAVYEVIR